MLIKLLHTSMGVVTQNERLRKEHFIGLPEMVMHYFQFVAEETQSYRHYLKSLLFLIANVNRLLGFEKSADDFIDMKGKRVVCQKAQEFAFQTSNPKVFAGGDMVRGSSLVVHAIDDARKAAHAMLDYMGV